MTKVSRGKVVVEAKEEGKYEILDGFIQGQFQKIQPKERIEMLWKMKDWSQFSKVTFELIDEPEEECSELKVVQREIPEEVDLEHLERGWENMIMKPLEIICGYPRVKE